jgi:ribosomal protein S18 acetylase RimI-like enzyme
MAEVYIRRAAGPDLPYCYGICLKTGDAGKDASGSYSDPLLLGQYYAAPYFFYDDSLCFVVDDGHRPWGYIVSVADTLMFNRWMEENWLPSLRRHYPQPSPETQSDGEKSLIALIHNSALPRQTPSGPAVQPWVASYPAHLHINILPELQGKGVGRALVETLLDELWSRGCPGVHLGVSIDNTAAQAFYTRLGFSFLQEAPWGFVMGMKNGGMEPKM